MAAVIVLASLVFIGVVLHDGFEVILLPRRVSRKLRLARLFYIGAWRVWRLAATWIESAKRREAFLSWFGPASAIQLFAIWAGCLIAGFAAIHWALGTALNLPGGRPGSIAEYLYFSGVTFFTLGFGDLAPVATLGRFLAVAEAGIGFGFLAAVIGYLPVFYQAFSSREIGISLLDARAGSPPTAAALLLRLASSRGLEPLDRFFQEWERWAAQVLESHLSFPLVSYYRSQHDNQSWLAAMTAILDASALTIAGAKRVDPYQAELAFAMARHAVVDLAQAYQVPPIEAAVDRMPPDRLLGLLEDLQLAGLDVRDGSAVGPKLAELRGMYEPFVLALSAYFLLPLPPIQAEAATVDNWQTSAWMKQTRGIGTLARADPGDDHDD